MNKIVRTTVEQYHVKIELEDGTHLYVSCNEGYFYFVLSGIEVPTKVNPDVGDTGCLSNNTLTWKYKKLERY